MKRRKEFQRLLNSCWNGEIDIVLVKSVSRFVLDSLEMFKILREVHRLDADVFFEKEGVHSRDHYLRYYLTVYCAFAQAQSGNASRNIRWGIEHGFKDGTSGYAAFVCFGYKRDKDGAFCPDEPNASIVRVCLRCGPPAPASVRYEIGCINRAFLPTGKSALEPRNHQETALG